MKEELARNVWRLEGMDGQKFQFSWEADQHSGSAGILRKLEFFTD